MRIHRANVLEQIVTPSNLGAAFRSAAGLGADAVLLSPTCADPSYRRSVKVSMGTVFQVPWTRIEPWPEGLGELRDAGFTVAALALAEGAVALGDFAAAGQVVTIPMAGSVDSLNVAAASAVAVWAVTHGHGGLD